MRVRVQISGRLSTDGTVTSFAFTTDSALLISSELAPRLEVPVGFGADLKQTVGVLLRTSDWFRTDEGAFIDPRSGEHTELIHSSIAAGMAPFVAQSYRGLSLTPVATTASVVATHQDGSIIAALGAVDESAPGGVLYVAPTGEEVAVWGGTQSPPGRAVIGQYTVLFANWSAATVDVAVVGSEGAIEIARNVDISSIAGDSPGGLGLQVLSASDGVQVSPQDLERLRLAARMLRLAVCAVALTPLSGPAAPLLLISGVACVSTLIQEIAGSLVEQFPALEGTATGIAFANLWVGCPVEFNRVAAEAAIHWINGITQGPTAILGLISCAVDALVVWLEQVEMRTAEIAAANREAVDEALNSLTYRIFASSGLASTEGFGFPPSDLYIVEPSRNGRDILVGRMRTSDGTQPVITDLALSPDGALLGISFEKLYLLGFRDATAEELCSPSVSGTNALSFDSNGNLFGATTDGRLLEIDPVTCQTIERGSYESGYRSWGDIAFSPNGTLFGTVRDGESSSILVTIDLASGIASPVQPGTETGFDIWGLAFVGDELFGLTTDRASGNGKVVRVSFDGTAIVVRDLSFDAFGAGSAAIQD